MSPEELTAAAEEVLGNGETVTAAGAFALQDSYAAVTAGMLTAGAALPGKGNPLTGGIGNLAGLEAGRQANAAAKGVTERMLVAVTDRSIHLLSLTAMGSTPQKLLTSFDRASTEVEVKKFGLSRRDFTNLHLVALGTTKCRFVETRSARVAFRGGAGLHTGQDAGCPPPAII